MRQEHSSFLNRLASAISSADVDDRNNQDNNIINPDDSVLDNNISDNPFLRNRPSRTPDNRSRPSQPRGSDIDSRGGNPGDRPGSTPRQNPATRPGPQSSIPSRFVPSVLSDETPVLLTSLQRQDRRAPSTQDRSNAPLVTPGQSPSRSRTDRDNSARDTGRRTRDMTDDDTSTQDSNNLFQNDSRFSSNSPFVQALQQMASRRLAFAQNDLTRLSGDNFDRAFMQLEVALHSELVASQSAMASAAVSNDVKQLLNEGVAMDEQHLSEAQQLLSQLQGNVSDDTGSINDSTSNPDVFLRNNNTNPSRTRSNRGGDRR
jgi:hypothetical protein